MAWYSHLAAFVALGLIHGHMVAAQSGEQKSETKSTLLPDCPPQFAGRGDPKAHSTEPFNCHCTADARKLRGGYAYGSGPYDGISNICMAALHSGATGKDGGDVRVIPGPVLESFVGTLANGVFSSDWDHPSQFGSFSVEAYSGE